MPSNPFIAGAVLAFAALAANAQDAKVGAISITHAYARATVPGQPGGGAFLTIANAGADDKLVAVSTAAAKNAELHTMAMDGNVMRMRQVDAIALPAGKTVELKPGNYHVMLTGLKAPLKAGERFALSLKFEKAGEVQVEVPVEALGAAMAMPAGASGAMK
ncbi:MAG TPA: copper chaperone PCu(A)C [Burkholderiaceae bacterium]